MSYLSYISDENLISHIKYVLDKGRKRKHEAEKDFNKNVIDPFGALFEVAAFDLNHDMWKKSETIRQCQKILQNHVGCLHQNILGNIQGWKNSNDMIDLECADQKIIAEIKNKYNTVTGGKLSDQYRTLKELIMPKKSAYYGYTAFFVNIIPKKPGRFCEPFTPSDNSTGEKCQENQNIKIIDGASFYALATGEENALMNFYNVLPTVIEDIFRNEYNNTNFEIYDKAEFSKYFTMAYLSNHE